MKNLYVCEFCGTQFEDYSEAMHCEETHLKLGYEFPNQLAFHGKRCTYMQGDKIPRTCVLVSQADYSKDIEKPEYYFGMYKLVRMLNNAEVQEILDEKAAQDAENRRVWEEWKKEQEEKKVEEQTA